MRLGCERRAQSSRRSQGFAGWPYWRERRTAFEGEFSFETSDQADAVAAELGGEESRPRCARPRNSSTVRDRTVHVRFPPVEEMSVTAVGEDHHTACILHDEGVRRERILVPSRPPCSQRNAIAQQNDSSSKGMKETWERHSPNAYRMGCSNQDGRWARTAYFAPFRPPEGDEDYAILAYGPYAKGLTFQEGYVDAWRTMVEGHPDVAAGSSNRYQAWEVCDPEKWVPGGYAVRVDARGWGRSPGYIEPWSPREAQDLHDCIEWAGAQPWSNGKVGLLGISYYAINQWHVAALQPPSLAAMIPWEGFADFYRDLSYHGGIASDMKNVWYRRTVTTVQHGLGNRAAKNPNTVSSSRVPKRSPTRSSRRIAQTSSETSMPIR